MIYLNYSEDGCFEMQNEKRSDELTVIAHISSPFSEKFGIPRQSGLAEDILSRIVFVPPFGTFEAFRGIEGYSHLWLIWKFSKVQNRNFSPTVRPPKLGGNKRVGVFATRSPFRPNNLALSCVKLEKVETDEHGSVCLVVSGADLMDGTPIYDIKPYLPYTDSHPEALSGFSKGAGECELEVIFDDELLSSLPPELQSGAVSVLKQDPRPGYQSEPERMYYIMLSEYEIAFTVDGKTLTVKSVEKKGR